MKLFPSAKINLFLHITGKRPDGYHNLISLMCRIGLYDTLSLTFNVGKTAVSCSHPEVPEDETNLAHKAANLFLKTLNAGKGVKIFIDKKIPVGAGLGGGSSNAAAVLLGLNRFYGSPYSRKELMDMGLSIGADVPFFIFGKPAIAGGIGEKLKEYNALEPCHVLLIFPEFNVSTADVYKKLNLGLTKCEKELKKFILNRESTFDVKRHLCNDLETVTSSIYPEIEAAREALVKNGAEGVLMSGSGPSVFGLFHDLEKAKKAYDRLSRKSGWQFFLVDMLI
jgi:4-diphosphocytidyl-2-C-methyl-D-erythritol kinase